MSLRWIACLFRGHDPVRQPVGGFRCATCGLGAEDLGQLGAMDGGYVHPVRREYGLERRGLTRGGGAAVVLLALGLTGCGTVIRAVSTPIVAVINAGFWASERLDCGLKCPKDSSCQPYHSGVFASDSTCTCKYGETKAGHRYPTKGDPCPPKPSPSPEARR